MTHVAALGLLVSFLVANGGAPSWRVEKPLSGSEDWPQFRGPDGQGHSAERDLPVEWSESRNVAWKVPVPGLGWSSPVIAGGRVWLTTATGDRDVSLRALAYDADTGREVVNVEVFRIRSAEAINPKNSHASPTPVLEGDRVYVHFGAHGTAALTTSGDIVWKTRFPYTSQHGAGGSPVLVGDLLVFSCDGADAAFVVALDKRNGQVRWKTSRRSPWDQAYSTPLAILVGDRSQIVSVGAYRAAAYDPSSGKEIWRVGYADGFSNVPRPVYGHGLVYIATGFQQPLLLAVRADGTGDVTRSHLAWTLRRAAPLTPSPVLVGDELYLVNDAGIASCLNARTGDVLWQQRLGGTYSASPVYADGRIYFLSEQGVTTVVAPGNEFRRIATNALDGAILASPAVSSRSLFIRSDRHLYRIATATARPQQGAEECILHGRLLPSACAGWTAGCDAVRMVTTIRRSTREARGTTNVSDIDARHDAHGGIGQVDGLGPGGRQTGSLC